MSKKRPNKRGHFCWCCQRMRANERFSGRGHACHLCRECAKLGSEELAYRQAARNVDRLLTWDGMIRRRQRQNFERFLHHPNERVRNYARAVAAQAEQQRVQRREDWRLATEAEEFWYAEFGDDMDAADLSADGDDVGLDSGAECLPF